MATLEAYFRLLSDLDLDAWIELWAERCVIEAPYAPPSIPELISGRAAVYEFYREQAAGYARLSFPNTVLQPMADPGRVLARWYPDGELTTGAGYRNQNVGVFEFDAEGKIKRLTEYFDPAPLTTPANPS
ncbi:nuclear transport factor 2 family protein [Streptomyces sp. 8K308]|uniref:nuclear transport factor 2 family protein n=1 Tax=Streptomyces sp. 8K308 TaxID=2530388 RepID=UPI001404E943|nr:nuclear transport factor 2 family protein [Streptomyces sp. 8K308]